MKTLEGQTIINKFNINKMNNTQTVEKLRQMRLTAMAELHQQHVTNNQFSASTPDEYLALLTDYEWEVDISVILGQ